MLRASQLSTPYMVWMKKLSKLEILTIDVYHINCVSIKINKKIPVLIASITILEADIFPLMKLSTNGMLKTKNTTP